MGHEERLHGAICGVERRESAEDHWRGCEAGGIEIDAE